MNRFYFSLWSHWAVRVTLCSLVLAGVLAFLITLSLYFLKGMQLIDKTLLLALYDIFVFWFMILWNFTLLLALFRSLKYIFNKCYQGYALELYTCQKEKIPRIAYGDLVKLWRKWVMTMIWLVGTEMIFMVVLSYVLDLNDWFSVYLLYLFILSAGYISFILLSSRCKQVKIVKC